MLCLVQGQCKPCHDGRHFAEAKPLARLANRSEQIQRYGKGQRCHLFRRRCSPWQAAVSARLHSRHARRRTANNGSNRFRDVAEQSELSGFQFVVARCHRYRGRGGWAVDAVNGRLHGTREGQGRCVRARTKRSCMSARASVQNQPQSRRLHSQRGQCLPSQRDSR